MKTPSTRSRAGGFTLVELILVTIIIVAVLLPAVQSERESVNEHHTQGDLDGLYSAEKTYFHSNGSYTNSFSALNLASEYPNDSADGYIFTITASSTTFVATATPVNPGLNGSLDFQIDQTGHLVSSPDPGAASQHTQTTIAMADAARTVISQAIATTDTNQTMMPSIQKGITEAAQVTAAFKELSGGGNTLTITDITGYSGQYATQLAPLLTAIQDDFLFGTGGEDTSSFSVTLPKALSSSSSSGIKGVLVISDGASTLLSSSQAQIAASCAGTLDAGTEATLHKPSLVATLNLTTGQTGGSAWSGTGNFEDAFGFKVGCLLVGELLPAVQSTGGDDLALVVIALGPAGSLSGGAGLGPADISLDGALGSTFTGSLHISPPK